MKTYLITTALLTFTLIGARAQTVAPASVQTASRPTPALVMLDQQQSQSAPAKLEVLQAQLQTMKEYHGSLLDTVYWAMGGVFLIAGTLIGFGWFANFKVYERDKSSLRADLEAHLRERILDLEKSLHDSAATSEKALLAKLDSLVKEVRVELNTNTASVESAAKQRAKSLDQALVALKVTVLDKSMRRCETPTGAITEAVALLELCATSSPSNLDRTLAFMMDQLEKGGKLLVWEISRITAVLIKLPPEHKAYVDRIGAKLLDAKMI